MLRTDKFNVSKLNADKVYENGSIIIDFNRASDADVVHYVNNIPGTTIIKDNEKIILSIHGDISVTIDGTIHKYFSSIEDAINNYIKPELDPADNPAIYIRKNEYLVTDADELAISQLAGEVASVTYTSNYLINDLDAIVYGETEGSEVTRDVFIDGDIINSVPTYFNNINLVGQAGTNNIMGNGYKLAIGCDGVNSGFHLHDDTVNEITASDIVVAGGSNSAFSRSVELHIGAGDYTEIVGGNINDTDITGNVSVNVSNASGSKFIGGSKGGNISGGVTTVLENLTVNAGGEYIGASESGNIGGGVSTTLTDCVFLAGTTDVLGSKAGNIGDGLVVDLNGAIDFGNPIHSMGSGTLSNGLVVDFNTVTGFDTLECGPMTGGTLSGNVVVNVNDSTVSRVNLGANTDATMTSTDGTLNLSNATVEDISGGVENGVGRASTNVKINVVEESTVGRVEQFDLIYINGGKVLTIEDHIDSNGLKTNTASYGGGLDFGVGSTVKFTKDNIASNEDTNFIRYITVNGANAGTANLVVNDLDPTIPLIQTLDNYMLRTDKFNVSRFDDAKVYEKGSIIIDFNRASDADVVHYNNMIPSTIIVKDVEKIILSFGIISVTIDGVNYQRFDTLKNALVYINNHAVGANDFGVCFRDDYVLSDDDIAQVGNMDADIRSITYTSKLEINDDDVMAGIGTLGDVVTNSVTLGADLSLDTNSYFNNINLVSAGSSEIFANGNLLNIGMDGADHIRGYWLYDDGDPINNNIIGNTGLISVYGGNSTGGGTFDTDISIGDGLWEHINGGNKDGLLNGDTSVVIAGGEFDTVSGNNSNSDGNSTTLLITDGTFNGMVAGGNARDVVGVSTKGDISVTINGGLFKSEVVLGNANGALGGNVTGIVNDGNFEDVLYMYGDDADVAGHVVSLSVNGLANDTLVIDGIREVMDGDDGSDIIVNLASDLTIDSVVDFDQLNINGNIIVSELIDYNTTGDSTLFDGDVVVASGKSLQIPGAKASVDLTNSVGTLDTGGANAILKFSDTDGVVPSIVVNTVGGTKTNGAFELQEVAGSVYTAGDILVRYPDVDSAKKENYHGSLGGYGTAKNGVDVVIGGFGISLVRTVGGVSSEHKYFTTVQEAMNDIAANDTDVDKGNTDYSLFFRTDNYTIEEVDAISLLTEGSLLKSLTLTSRIQLNDHDIKGTGETDGDIVTRNVIINHNNFVMGTPTTYIDDMTMVFSDTIVGVPNVYANGSNLFVGTGDGIALYPGGEGNIDMVGKVPNLYGGSPSTGTVIGGVDYSGDLVSTNMVIEAGTYNNIYGGSDNSVGALDVDDVSIVLGEFGNDLKTLHVNGDIYGGNDGALDGTVGAVSIVVNNGDLGLAGGVVRDVKIVGGSADGGDVVGNISMVFNNGSANDHHLVVGGVEDGNAGSVDIVIPDGAINIDAASGSLYGVIGSGVINNDFNVEIQEGHQITNVGDVLVGKTGSVVGNKNFKIGNPDGLNYSIGNIFGFDLFEVGYTDAGIDVNCVLRVISQLDLSADSGELNIKNGSMITLPGGLQQMVGDLKATGTNNRLFVTKDGGVTNPIIVDRYSVIDPDLLVGVDADLEANGDNVIVYKEPIVVGDLGSFASADPAFELGIEDGSDRIVEFIIPEDPYIIYHNVIQKSVNPNLSGTVDKTLEFFVAIPDSSPRVIESAYITTSPTFDPTWELDGSTPTVGDNIVVGVVGAETVYGVDDHRAWPVTVDDPNSLLDGNYYIHARTSTGEVASLLIDTHAPLFKDVANVSKINDIYTISGEIIEPIIDGGVDFIYNEHHITDIGWVVENVGTTSKDNIVGQVDGLGEPIVVDWATSFGADKHIGFDPAIDLHNFSVEVSDAMIEAAGGIDNAILRVYTKDKINNVNRIDIILNDNVIDISIPSRIGVVAIKGGVNREVLSPNAFIYNNRNNVVKVEIIDVYQYSDVEIGIDPGDVRVDFVDSVSPVNNQVNVSIEAVDGVLANNSNFTKTAILDIDTLNPLELGTITSDSLDNSVDEGIVFNYDMLYDHNNIDITTDWAQFAFTYKFSLVK